MTKRFFLILALALQAVCAPAQNNLEQVRKIMESSKVSLEYSCTIPGKVPFKSSGSICVQRNCYKLLSSGYEIYCDGKTRWTVDLEAKEICIEETSGVEEFLKDSEYYMENLDDLVLSNVTSHPFDKDDSEFIFSTEGLEAKGWIITDLR